MREAAGTTSKKIEPRNVKPHTKQALVDYAGKKGMDATAFDKALGLAGFKDVDLTRWDELIKAADDCVVPA